MLLQLKLKFFYYSCSPNWFYMIRWTQKLRMWFEEEMSDHLEEHPGTQADTTGGIFSKVIPLWVQRWSYSKHLATSMP